MARNAAIGLAAARLHSTRVAPNRIDARAVAPLTSLTSRIRDATYRRRTDLRLRMALFAWWEGSEFETYRPNAIP